eukprot:8986904-Pyramimonas_sp.AAC.1
MPGSSGSPRSASARCAGFGAARSPARRSEPLDARTWETGRRTSTCVEEAAGHMRACFGIFARDFRS